MFKTSTFNDKQKHIFDFNFYEQMNPHISRSPWKWNSFFVKSLTHQLQLQGKKVLLLATTRVVPLWLSPHAFTIHSMFKIHVT
jgi:hypothetical protein